MPSVSARSRRRDLGEFANLAGRHRTRWPLASTFVEGVYVEVSDGSGQVGLRAGFRQTWLCVTVVSPYPLGVTDDARPASSEVSHVASRSLFSGLPIVVWVLCGFFVATMLMWTIVKVAYEQPDERAHVSAVLYWSEFREWPAAGDMRLMLSAMRSAEFVGDAESRSAPPRPDRPSFEELTGESLLSATSHNQMSQHPPLYYMGLSVLHDRLPDNASGVPADTEVWLFRLVSILLTAMLPLLSAALARSFGASRPVVVLAAALTATFPGLAVIGAAVNNDNLLNIASAWAILGIGIVLTGDLRRRTALWIGFALSVALLTKAFAMPVAFSVGVAYLVAIRRTRRFRDGSLALGLTILVAALGGWWWLWNLQRYGRIQPTGIEIPPTDPLSTTETLRIWSDQYLDVFFTRFWLMLDSPSLRSPVLWLSVAATVVGLVVFTSAIIAFGRTQRRQMVDTLMISMPFVVALAILLSSTFRIAMREAYAAGVQGRYLYSGLVGVIVALALGFEQIVPRSRQVHIPPVLGLIGIGVSLWRVSFEFQRRWLPGSSVMKGFEAMFAWAPIPYAASAVIVALFFVATIVSIAMLARELATGTRIGAGSAATSPLTADPVST